MTTPKRQIGIIERAAAPDATHYTYQNDQGEYYTGWPGPGATIPVEDYHAMPPEVQRLFVPIPPASEAPTTSAPTDGGKE